MKGTWLTMQAAAKRLGVSRPTVYYYLGSGRLSHRHVRDPYGKFRTEVFIAGRPPRLPWGAKYESKPRKGRCRECAS